MNKLQFIAYPAIAAALFGCAAMTERDKTVERLNTEVTQLKRSTDETNARLDELNNKFNLLSDKLESVSGSVSAQVAAPEGLKVVKLGENGEARKQAQPPQEQKQAKQAPAEVRELAPAPAAITPATAPAQPQSQPHLGEDALYGRAIELIRSGRYIDARASFNDFLRDYPSSKLAGNAFYWIGETYYTEKDFNTAIEKFGVVPDKYPASNKAPDALLKVGYSYLELHEKDKARETLHTLVRRYPGSEAAGKAKKTLGNVLAAPSKKRK